MKDEQAVTTEADVESTTSTEDSGAQEVDLDSVLAEFDEDTSDQSEQSDQGSEQQTTNNLESEDLDFIKDLKAQETRRQIDEEMKKMRENLPDDLYIPERAFRGMVEIMASENPKIAQAFANRNKNPAAWEKASKAIATNIAKEFDSQPDDKSTQDREAVVAAVKSVSTSSQESELPKFSEMNDQQFAEFERKQR